MSRITPIQAPIVSQEAPVVSGDPATDPTLPDALERLIDICADGVEGHERSASSVEDEVAQPLFEAWGAERAEFLAALQEVAAPYGVTVEEPGTVTGTVHRAWIATLDSIAGDDAVISAAARGEKVAMETYEEVLEGDLPNDVRTVVQQQYEQIREIHERLENWDTV